MQYLMLLIKGLAVGAANIVPGISGATLAIVLRIYDRLIQAINQLFTNTKDSLKFLLPLGVGMAVGIIALGSAIDFLHVEFPLQFAGFIAGLLAGSLPFIHSQATSKGKKKSYLYVIAIIAAILIVLPVLFAPAPELYQEASFSFGFVAFVFFGGAIAAAAMVIPGVSGAMVLILLGIYPLVMRTITLIREYILTPLDFELLWPILIVTAPLGLGMVVGILLCSKLIALLLEKFHSATYFAILGLVFGTIFIMFNDVGQVTITPLLLVFTAFAFIFGLVISLLLGRK